MKIVRSLGLVIAALALAAGCGSAMDAPQQTGGTPETAQYETAQNPATGAPLQFTAKTIDGADFSGQSLVGEPAVLWFWAPWCPVCQREAPTVS